MTARKKIHILISDLTLGGAEQVMLALVPHFMQTHQVDLICLRKKGSLLANVPGNLPLRFLAPDKASWLLLAVNGLIGIRKIIIGDENAVVLSTGTGTNLLACAARAISPGGARVVIREACSSKNSSNPVIALLKRLLYPHADGMIGVSDGVAEELKALAGKRLPIASIPNPVDVERINALAAMPDRTLADFPHAFILTVGRLVPQKNTALLIDAFARIATSVDEHLVIIGAGPLESELQRRIAAYDLDSKVHMLGEIANPHPWYRRASAFVLCSDSEGYPNVLLEALVHGLPVISTDCQYGPSQILMRGKFGILVPVRDVEAMANAIRMILNGETETIAWHPEDFSVSATAARYLAFTESCRGQ